MSVVPRRLDERAPVPAWTVLGAVGGLALAVALWNFSRELAGIGLEAGPVVAAALGVALASAIIFAAYRLRESDFDADETWTVVTTGVGVGLFTTASYGLTVLVRLAEGRPLAEPVFPATVVGALGVLGGVVIGRERVTTRRLTATAKESRDAMAFTNSLLRHDVRNGLQIIGGYTARLAGHDDEAVRECAEAIDAQVESLDQLVAEVQSVTDVLTGDVDTETVDLTAVLADVVDRADDRYPDATVERDLPDELPVRGADALYSVFDNLVENAVDHNPGAVRVRVTGERDGDVVRVRVADDGHGIPEGERDTIFEQGVSKDGGGHGLYVARTIVDRLDGSIRVADSDLGGVAFVVELPAADSRQTEGDDDPFGV